MSASSIEIASILKHIAAGKFALSEMALATVVEVSGSAYRRVGARMLILHNGNWEGSISGGCLEGNALRLAREVMLAQAPRLITYDTRTDDDARILGASLGCNGVIKVWIEPVRACTADDLRAMQAAFAGECETWWARLVAGEMPDMQCGDQRQLDGVCGEILRAQLQLEDGLQTFDIDGVRATFAVECVVPTIRLLVFGGGEDARPLTQLAAQMGWRVTVTDDCAAKALPVRFPEATQVLHLPRETAVAHLQPDRYTAAVLLSHNYGYDKAILEKLAAHALPYIGILGPRSRFTRLQAELGDALPDAHNIHAPIGLDIGGQTPFEIALAIVAEVQAVFATRKGAFLRDRNTTIHPRKSSTI